MDDIAAAAWGDDASPGHSPKLDERDIWGAPERLSSSLHERDEAVVNVGAETTLNVEEGEDVDVWAVPSSRTDIVGPAASAEQNDTRTEEPSTVPLDTNTVISPPIPTSGSSPIDKQVGLTRLTIPTPVDDPSMYRPNEQEDSFDDFEDDPFPAAAASSSSAYPLPTSTSPGAFLNDNSNSNNNNEEEEGEAADDFADFGDFEDFDEMEPAAGGTPFPSSAYQNAAENDGFGSVESEGVEGGAGGVRGFGAEFTEEPLDVWDDPDRPAPLKPLSLDPFPPPDLTDQIATLLDRIFPHRDDPAAGGENLTREGVRQVEGVNQVLVTDASRELYTQLVTPPPLKPLDWKRSRTRREQLISLGIPVNLDEVDTSRLPPLKITTKEGQAAAAAAAAKGRPERQRTKDERMLGDSPPFDRERAERLLSYREDQLSLVPPAYLTRMQQDLVSTLSSASAVVAHLKQTRDALTEDNKAKNEQIAGLIAQAQRMKAAESAAGGGGAGGVFRKASVRHRVSHSLSLSGGNTPRRVNSPGGMMR